MFNSLLITLREGLEAALIIGIILGYLAKVDQKQYYKHVFAGVGFGVISSVVAAILFQTFAGGFEGKAEQLFEGIVLLIAVFILTTMVLWMNRQSKSLGAEIRQKLDAAIGENHIWGLASLAFVSIFREGIEIVLFMNATVSNASAESSILGGVLGLVSAMIIAWFVFKSTNGLNLKTFFQITGAFIILISAGMLAAALRELGEAGVLPTFIEHLWNMNGLLNEESILGLFLKSIFGYNGDPSILEVFAYISYLAITMKLFFSAKPKIQ
jgi:high-affinity iron transporter